MQRGLVKECNTKKALLDNSWSMSVLVKRTFIGVIVVAIILYDGSGPLQAAEL